MGKRANGEGTIKQRSDGRWEGQYVDTTGKRRSVYAKTQREVRTKVREAIGNRDKGLPAPTGGHQTVAQFLARWLADVVKPNGDPRTYESHESRVRLHIVPIIGKIKLTTLTVEHVQSMLTTLRDAKSPSCAKSAHTTLRAALSVAEDWDLVARNVARKARPGKVERKKPDALTPEQARRILDAIRGDRFEALYLLGLWTGGRISELLAVRWADVDAGRRELRPGRQLQRLPGQFNFVDLKTESSRRAIPLDDVTIEALRVHRERQGWERKLAGDERQDLDLVFCTATGGPVHRTWATRHFQELLAKAGLPHMTLHHLRHGQNTLLAALGVDPRTRADILGHADPSLTIGVYTHSSEAMRREAIERLSVALRQH